MNENDDIDEEKVDIDRQTVQQRIEMNELFQRNIQRCFETGKYVPVKAIIDVCLRVDELVDRAVMDMKREYQKGEGRKSGNNSNSASQATSKFTKFQLDCTLSKLAGFHMNDDRTVRRIDSTTTKNDIGLQSSRNQQISRQEKRTLNSRQNSKGGMRNPNGSSKKGSQSK